MLEQEDLKYLNFQIALAIMRLLPYTKILTL